MDQVFNWLTDKLGFIVDTVMVMLPDSPFVMLQRSASVNQVIGIVNWIVPFSQMVAILQVWLTAVAVYYVYQIILRWAKAVE